MSSSVGMKNVLQCSIVAGIYETLLEYTFVAGEKRYVVPPTHILAHWWKYNHSMECCQNVLKMFRGHQLAINILKENGIVLAGKCGGCGLILMGVADRFSRCKER